MPFPTEQGPLLKAHLAMCSKTEAALNECLAGSKSEDGSFPAACNTAVVEQIECVAKRRESAVAIATSLVGKDKVEKVLPYFEEHKEKTLDLVRIYKENAGKGGDGEQFWQPAV
eukprot:CAMPEP_0198134620 /NCGR_PEP_ID=MMETSP1442-20131203/60168_1 /TAXON_ID= /ORGANISM="Craspedostauros australis, Strain CCMP3328" /LENGTH=113 /DNA_ID=CAMNT_0043795765 /DNA_START=599 /DNA_END=940 /DNA_ORIENTATION=-